MGDHDSLAQQFEDNRSRLRAVAFRMLGSASEADDAVQEAWLKLSHFESRDVRNLRGWLTTVVARVCVDILRSRKSRLEEPLGRAVQAPGGSTAESDLGLVDAIAPALLVVLDMLAPAERVAFVLHDIFDLSFDEIAPVVDRTPAAARQLASRARRRVRGTASYTAGLEQRRELVSAFLAASRDGDFERLLAVLSPDVVLRADSLAVRTAAERHQYGAPTLVPEIRGAPLVAEAFKGRARGASPALLDGEAGAVWAMGGQVRSAFAFAINKGKITDIDLIMEPARLAALHVTIG